MKIIPSAKLPLSFCNVLLIVFVKSHDSERDLILLDQNSTPIFILGMPRSGSTLVEQILSSHPRVYGGDELNFLPTLIKKNIDNREKGLFLKNIMNIDNQNLIMFGKDYINQLNNLSNNSEKVTDKLPVNFKWIGFIKLILPNSKIVHCVRNSKDNCLSIFRNYF